MKIEEVLKILAKDGEPMELDLGYDPGYVSDEENEEIIHALEQLTEDDLQTARIERVSLKDGRVKEVTILC